MEKVVQSAEQKLEEMDTTDEKTKDMEDTDNRNYKEETKNTWEINTVQRTIDKTSLSEQNFAFSDWKCSTNSRKYLRL